MLHSFAPVEDCRLPPPQGSPARLNEVCGSHPECPFSCWGGGQGEDRDQQPAVREGSGRPPACSWAERCRPRRTWGSREITHAQVPADTGAGVRRRAFQHMGWGAFHVPEVWPLEPCPEAGPSQEAGSCGLATPLTLDRHPARTYWQVEHRNSPALLGDWLLTQAPEAPPEAPLPCTTVQPPKSERLALQAAFRTLWLEFVWFGWCPVTFRKNWAGCPMF